MNRYGQTRAAGLTPVLLFRHGCVDVSDCGTGSPTEYLARQYDDVFLQIGVPKPEPVLTPA